MILVTGGNGFIGSNFIKLAIQKFKKKISNIDALTYAGVENNLQLIANNSDYSFFKGSINDKTFITKVLNENRPNSVVHFAAESHVDRSITEPDAFIETNIGGTFNLLKATKNYWEDLKEHEKENFRFIHISTDEVYGSLDFKDEPFKETSAYAPNSPYSASKAASDHLARAYFKTYNFPVITSHCSNNYGPNQFPEKFIPVIITKAFECLEIPIYGDGLQIRDWIYVKDHCEAIFKILEKGEPGETYNIGGNAEISNIELAKKICNSIDQIHPITGINRENLIKHISDRPGHDRRYAINIQKIKNELKWSPKTNLDDGLINTVNWYLENIDWAKNCLREN